MKIQILVLAGLLALGSLFAQQTGQGGGATSAQSQAAAQHGGASAPLASGLPAAAGLSSLLASGTKTTQNALHDLVFGQMKYWLLTR